MNSIQKRYLFTSYAMFEYKDMEDTLTRMAAKAWKIERIGSLMWRYKKGEPTNQQFFVAYPSDVDLCYEKGWRKEIQWKEIEIFSIEAGAPPLEVSEASRVENACLAMKKAFIPNLRIGFFLLVSYILFDIFRILEAPTIYDEQAVWTFVCTVCVTIICGVRLLNYSIWEKTSRRCLLQGKAPTSTKRFRQILNILQIGTLITFVVAGLQFIR